MKILVKNKFIGGFKEYTVKEYVQYCVTYSLRAKRNKIQTFAHKGILNNFDKIQELYKEINNQNDIIERHTMSVERYLHYCPNINAPQLKKKIKHITGYKQND
jgi:hypothetical protein